MVLPTLFHHQTSDLVIFSSHSNITLSGAAKLKKKKSLKG